MADLNQLHTDIDEGQKALDKKDSSGKNLADGSIQNSTDLTQTFITDVDEAQTFLQAHNNDLGEFNDEEFLKGVKTLLTEALSAAPLDTIKAQLDTHLASIKEKMPNTTAPDAAETTGIPRRPNLGENTILTLKSSDTLTGIVASKFGVDWKQTPNAAFVLVHALNNLRDDTKKIDPDALTDGETIDVNTILNGWNNLPWNEDALGWYKRTSQASQKDSWVSGLRKMSEEKGERQPIRQTEDYDIGEVVAGDIAKQNPYIMQLGAGYDGSIQDNYTLLDGWAWNNATNKADFGVKKVEVSRTAGALSEGSVDNTPIGQEYDESDAAEDARKAAELAAKTKLTPQDSEYGTLVVDGALTEAATQDWRWENPADTKNTTIVRIVREQATPYEAAQPAEGVIQFAEAYAQGLVQLKEPSKRSTERQDYKISDPRRYAWNGDRGLDLRELEGPPTGTVTFQVDTTSVNLDYSTLSEGAAKSLKASTAGFRSEMADAVTYYLPRALNADGQYGAESGAKYSPFRVGEDGGIKFADYGSDDDVTDIVAPTGMTKAQCVEILNALTYQTVKTQERPANAAEAAPEGAILDLYVRGSRITLDSSSFTDDAIAASLEQLSASKQQELEVFLKTILEQYHDENVDDDYARAPFQIDHDVSGEDAIEIKEGWTDYNDDIITLSGLNGMNVGLSLAQMRDVLNLLWRKTH